MPVAPLRSSSLALRLVWLAALLAAPAVATAQSETAPTPTLGAPDAAVSVVEVRSFACDRCQAFHRHVFPALRKKYLDTKQIAWRILDTAVAGSERGHPIFEAARCLARQNNYWENEALLFANAHRPSSIFTSRIEAAPGIDRGHFNECLRSGATRAEVQANFREIDTLNVTVLPTFILTRRFPDGRTMQTRLEGFQDEQFFTRTLDALMSASPPP